MFDWLFGNTAVTINEDTSKGSFEINLFNNERTIILLIFMMIFIELIKLYLRYRAYLKNQIEKSTTIRNQLSTLNTISAQ